MPCSFLTRVSDLETETGLGFREALIQSRISLQDDSDQGVKNMHFPDLEAQIPLPVFIGSTVLEGAEKAFGLIDTAFRLEPKAKTGIEEKLRPFAGYAAQGVTVDILDSDERFSKVVSRIIKNDERTGKFVTNFNESHKAQIQERAGIFYLVEDQKELELHKLISRISLDGDASASELLNRNAFSDAGSVIEGLFAGNALTSLLFAPLTKLGDEIARSASSPLNKAFQGERVSFPGASKQAGMLEFIPINNEQGKVSDVLVKQNGQIKTSMLALYLKSLDEKGTFNHQYWGINYGEIDPAVKKAKVTRGKARRDKNK